MATQAITDIALDPFNPRLPEEVARGSQADLLQHLFDNEVLDELAKSFADNGYFEHEPLIITADETDRLPFVVLEGNRRLAALKILTGSPPAGDLDLKFDIELPVERLDQLRSVPVYQVPSREAVRKYLGFRHIGGIKAWSPEAKARYLYAEVERAHESGEPQPFRAVGRRVGSNSQGVRNSYVALLLLRSARDDYGIPVSRVMNERFGVWLRAMTSGALREYISYPPVTDYEDAHARLTDVDSERLAEVIADLTPTDGQKALLADSREVTQYSRVLSNDRAREVLRKTQDLRLAQQVVDQLELPLRIRRLKNSVDIVFAEAERAEPTDDLLTASEELYVSARSLRNVVRGRLDDSD